MKNRTKSIVLMKKYDANLSKLYQVRERERERAEVQYSGRAQRVQIQE